MEDQEIEVKFLISDLTAVRSRLDELGAVMTHARVFERNLRFDNDDRDISGNKQTLRLRKDSKVYLTFKGPSQSASVAMRQEIEIEVSDFDAAWHMLDALGYHAYVTYEKYRTTYQYLDSLITLDELPYGNFIEIEGPSEFSLRMVAGALNVNWNYRIVDSYLGIYGRLLEKLNKQEGDLTFSALHDLSAVTPAELDLIPADILIP